MAYDARMIRFFLMFALVSIGVAAPAQQRSAPLRTALPRSATTIPSVAAIFAADRAVTLRPGVDGRVVAVGTSEGARVKTGTMLVKLDDREQRARVALAAQGAASTAEQSAAEVRGREAQARLGGTSSAAASGAATSWEVRQARAAADAAAMDARMARDRRAVEGQRLQLERVVLENYIVAAPFAGRVTRLGARVGMTVRKSDAIATIVDLGVLRGEAYVPVADYGRLKVGAGYGVTFGAPFGGVRRATLAYIDPAIDAGLVRCVFRLENVGETLPSGLQARISLLPLSK